MAMQVIRNSDGEAIHKSANLAGIRRHIAKHTAKTLGICRIGNGEGKLMILFENGSSFETNFASFTVLKGFVQEWRNAYGTRLLVDGTPSGIVEYSNPALR